MSTRFCSRNFHRQAIATVAALLLLSAGNAGLAQDGQKHLMLFGIPSATVAPSGLAFVSLSGSDRRTKENHKDGAFNEPDGSMAFGFGIGSAEDNIGFQVTAQITSLTDSFGDSGYFDFKASRRIGSGGTPLYLGFQVDHALSWGAGKLVDANAKVMLTYFSEIHAGNGETYPIIMTVGAGNKVRGLGADPGIFAGVGIGLTRNLGASVAWSGDYIDAGFGFKLDGLDNFNFTAGVSDLFDQHDRRRIVVSVSYVWRDLFGG